MKITKNELNNLIKEEVVRQKAIINLKSRKSSILKEMEEIGYAEPDQVEESWFTSDEKEKKDKLTKSYWVRGNAWWNKKAIKEKPSEANLAEVLKMAESDKYNGVIAHNNVKIIYKPSGQTKWAGPASHLFGQSA
jgi:hypothetical protein